MVKLGIICGTGFSEGLFEEREEIQVKTPYGKTTSPLIKGKIEGVESYVIMRHGKGHIYNPTNVNYKANIDALKKVGCTHILAITAVGSLRRYIKIGDIVFPNQLIDRTTKRDQTFYTGKKVCHISVAEPFCSKLRKLLSDVAEKLRIRYHKKATLLVIEGPRFNTRAESILYRKQGCDIINMTTVPEAVLAREAAMCYQPIAAVTDYDSFLRRKKPVSTEDVLKRMKKNVEKVQKIIKNAVKKIEDWDCYCKKAIEEAFI